MVLIMSTEMWGMKSFLRSVVRSRSREMKESKANYSSWKVTTLVRRTFSLGKYFWDLMRELMSLLNFSSFFLLLLLTEKQGSHEWHHYELQIQKRWEINFTLFWTNIYASRFERLRIAYPNSRTRFAIKETTLTGSSKSSASYYWGKLINLLISRVIYLL